MRDKATSGPKSAGNSRLRPLLLGLVAAFLTGVMLERIFEKPHPNPLSASSPVPVPAPGARGRVADWFQPDASMRATTDGITNNFREMTLLARAVAPPRAPSHSEKKRSAAEADPHLRHLRGTVALPNGELPIFRALRASRARPVDPRVAALAREITRDCRTDAERARALYNWITEQIVYDWQEWAHIVSGAETYLLPHDPFSVIERGTTVCVGYAWLYNDMARSIGLKSDFIIGNVRGYRGTLDDETISPYPHAWNSVKFDDAWHLMDATWGARQPGEAPESYLARNAYYFATPPNQMIFSHLPETPEWQLLATPVTADEFSALPNLKPSFFRDGLLLGNHFSDRIAMPEGDATGVALLAPRGIQIAASLTTAGRDVGAGHLLIFENGARRYILMVSLPAGDYLLRIYSRPADSVADFACSLDYAVEVRR